jgi:ATP-dependent Clp protease ATP-binding subunit ClpA
MFERFTDRARRVVVLAQEEARALNHNYIGTEHILLGLLSEGESAAAQALLTLDISLEAVRQQVEDTVGRGSRSPSGHIPFTPRAKKVLELSLREALQLSVNYIGPEHILLGLIREGEGVAVQVLVRLGGDLNRIRQQVIRLLPGRESEASDVQVGSDRPGHVRRSASVRIRLRAPASGGEVMSELTLFDALEMIGERLAAIEARLGIRGVRSRNREDLESEIVRLTALLRTHGIDSGADPAAQEVDHAAQEAGDPATEQSADLGVEPTGPDQPQAAG